MLKGGKGELFCTIIATVYFFWGLTIGDVREGSDEEHSTWSGGKEILDLLQCGWGERKKKKEKEKESNRNMIFYRILYFVRN